MAILGKVLVVFIMLTAITAVVIMNQVEAFVPEDIVGLEELDGVWYLWNENDDYYVNKSSGIQISNHYEEYWTKNVFCVWINTGSQWVRRCSDTFNWNCPTCGWVNTTDGATFAELNGTTYYTEGSYSAYFKIRYYLHSDSNEMNITLGVKNTGANIADSYFGWITKDIRIDGTEANDFIHLNLTGEQFNLNLSEPLAVEYTDLQGRGFEIRDKAYISLKWDDYGWKNDIRYNMNYKLNVTHSILPNQYNAPIGLLIHTGVLNNQDTVYTNFWWRDPAPSDCVHCVWIATGEDDFYRVESNALTVNLQHWQAPARSAAAFSVEYIDGFVYYTDYADDELVNMSIGGAEQNFWDISGFTSDVYGLCANETHFFLPGKTDDFMHITAITAPGSELTTFAIPVDVESCFYHPDDNTIYMVNAQDNVYNYSVIGAEQTGPWALHADMSAPTGIIWNSTHWLITDDGADEIFVLTTANLIGGAYSENINAVGTDLQGLAYFYNDLFPYHSAPEINLTEVFISDPINHSVVLADSVGLDTAIFSWNASGASCNVWENSSDIALSGATDADIGNETTVPTACAGKQIGYMFYYNDTIDQWNTTNITVVTDVYDVYKYGFLAVNWTYVPTIEGINSTTCSQSSPCEYNKSHEGNLTFNASANVTCVGGSGAKCGTVTGSIRYNKTSTTDPDFPINTTEGGDSMFVPGGVDVTTLAYWRPVNWTRTSSAFNNPEYAVDYRYNDITTRAYTAVLAQYANYTFDISDSAASGTLYFTMNSSGADGATFHILNWNTYSWISLQTAQNSLPVTYSILVNKTDYYINSTGGVKIKYIQDGASISYLYDTYITTSGNTYDYWGIDAGNDQDLMNVSNYSGNVICDVAWCPKSHDWVDETGYKRINMSDDTASSTWVQANEIGRTAFNIKINESVSDITSIYSQLEVRGFSTTALSDLGFYIWNSTEWSLLGYNTTIGSSDDDVGIYKELNTSISNYIDSDDYLHLKINISGKAAGSFAMRTDYIKVNVISTAGEADNPVSLGSMDNSDFHILNFTLNVSTATEQYNLLDFNFSSSHGTSNVATNDTNNAYVHLNKEVLGVPPVDSCEYTSGDWEVDCSENCDIDTNTDIGSNNLIFTGSGEIYMNADLIVGDAHFGDGCKVVFADGKTIVFE